MPHQLFRNLNAAINARNHARAVIAANAILRHYRLNTRAKNASNINRIMYALRLHSFHRQYGAYNVPNNVLWNIIRRE